ncbi:MAG: 4-(cytidine 5'-diphospho)-2-C-methyl-D-erythritol kinase [Sedimentisphaerales bacterium]|nr:4-(cytidine 5'-diphospho)-2-C-methyl-D-erythritol kinase [Sedimentisphaerales bacterium]
MDTPILGHTSTKYTAKSITLRPPAKLNLSLVVLDKRLDGFHDLNTVMATITLYDDLRLIISDKPGIHLLCTGLTSPPDKQNLVYIAAQKLAQFADIQPALDILLNKRIPAGGGLGGASSDAAACLWGLNQIWNLKLSTPELAHIAAQIGSDVPFFLYSPVALCTGRGEIIKELPYRPRRNVLLIVPDIHISTAHVYNNYIFDKIRTDENLSVIKYFLRLGDLDGLLGQGINSLKTTTLALSQPLRQLVHQLEKLDIGPIHMSGSGACLFTTGDSREKLSQWALTIKQHRLANAIDVEFHQNEELFLEDQHGDIGS